MFNGLLKFKKWITVFFILIIFSPLLVYVTLPIWQQIIRCQMLEALEAKNLVTIILKKNDLKWTRTGEEIIVRGNMFDVDHISKQGDNYIITGLYDAKESMLLQTIKKTQQTSGTHPLQRVLPHIITSILFIENKIDWQQVIFKLLFKNYYLYQATNFISFSAALAGPPPKYS